MKTSSIVNLLRVFAVLCLLAGGIAALGFAFENSDIAVPLVIISILVAVGGFVTYSAIANMMEAIDSIAETNKKIAAALEQQIPAKNDQEQRNTYSAKTAKDQNNSLPPM